MAGDNDGDGREDASDGGDETRKERLDRELIELLNELRVMLPGVQVLFAFLLTIPFAGSFNKLTGIEKNVYFGTFCATIIATAFFMMPSAYHRLRFRRGDKEQLLEMSNRAAIVGLVFLMAAICGAAYLIADLVFGGVGAAVTVLATAALIGALWFVLPLTREANEDR